MFIPKVVEILTWFRPKFRPMIIQDDTFTGDSVTSTVSTIITSGLGD